jgi:hypothetical protein
MTFILIFNWRSLGICDTSPKYRSQGLKPCKLYDDYNDDANDVKPQTFRTMRIDTA